MSYSKPFHRNFRGFVEGPNSGYSQWGYIVDREYANSPEHYTRAFSLIQSDLIKLFEYVEPADTNLDSYSYRIHELMIRTCIEVEANFKAILKENIFNATNKNGRARSEKTWNINDYKKVNKTHHLSSYEIIVPIWSGENATFTPFFAWGTDESLTWYQAYNKSKHDRQEKFKEANFRNLLNAVSGLLVLLSSQFRTEDFSPGESSLIVEGDCYNYYNTEPALGEFFHIKFPTDWTDDEKYDFNWTDLKTKSDRFQKINFNTIS